MMTAKKKKKKKTPPFITEELFSLRDPRIGDGREAVFQQESLSQVNPESYDPSEGVIPGMVEMPFQTASGRTLILHFSLDKARTSLFGVANQVVPTIEISFFDRSEHGEAQTAMSGKGEAFDIMRTVLAYSQKYLQQNTGILAVTFTAENAEKGRVKLYQVLARKFSVHETEMTQDDGATRFTVKNPYYEETVRISRLARISQAIYAVREDILSLEGLSSAEIPDVDFANL